MHQHHPRALYARRTNPGVGVPTFGRLLSLAAFVALTGLAGGCGDRTGPGAPRLTPLPLEWSTAPASATDLEVARAALIDFFAALADGDFERAAARYGGPYDGYLQGDAATGEERAALWGRACGSGEAACLPIGGIDESLEAGEGTYRFMVQFVDRGGFPLARKACCGEEAKDRPDETRFAFTVRRVGEDFVVLDKPLTMP